MVFIKIGVSAPLVTTCVLKVKGSDLDGGVPGGYFREDVDLSS